MLPMTPALFEKLPAGDAILEKTDSDCSSNESLLTDRG
jgi:hypothetical protein